MSEDNRSKDAANVGVEEAAPGHQPLHRRYQPTEEPPKKKPGRPRGSKNRPKAEAPSDQTEQPVKRKRGRPLGSKNKPKAAPPEPST